MKYNDDHKRSWKYLKALAITTYCSYMAVKVDSLEMMPLDVFRIIIVANVPWSQCLL